MNGSGELYLFTTTDAMNTYKQIGTVFVRQLRVKVSPKSSFAMWITRYKYFNPHPNKKIITNRIVKSPIYNLLITRAGK